jgi:DNA-binding NarL/FixJ family response regulator
MPSRKILVVEDFTEYRSLICSLLQPRTEFQLETAADGLEAIQKAEELQPDLILLDIGLPILNGLEVARRVRYFAPAAKILFLSIESGIDLVRQALNLGEGYIHKPRAQSDLVAAIEAVLRGERFVSGNLVLSETTPQHRHEVQFYSDDSVLIEGFARSISTALSAGDSAIALATRLHREGVVQKLKAQGFDIDGAMQQGTFVSLDAVEMLLTVMASGMPDVPRFFERLGRIIASAARATKKKHPRIMICGECAGLLCALGNTEAGIQLEKAANDLLPQHNLDTLCAYSLSSFDGGEDSHVFKRVCAEHTFVHSW